jgi:DNA end-binding protein Ku
MAPRPYWKGHLKLSLVSCPIALYPAVDASERVPFRQVNRATGHRLRQQLIDSVTGEAVESHAKARGYEVAENQFVVVENEELERAREKARTQSSGAVVAAEPATKVREEAPRREPAKLTEETRLKPPPVITPQPRSSIPNPRAIEIEHFIPRAQIDARYHLTPYYIAPRDLIGQEAFAVIRDAMAGKDVVGLGRVILSNRERPIILEPLGFGLRGITLRYAHEIRDEVEYFADIPEMVLPEKMQELAEDIVDRKLADFDPVYLEDRYRTALVSMLREKKAQIPPRAGAAVPTRENVINLMKVLKRSLAAEQPAAARRAERPRAAALVSKGASSQRVKMPKASRSK